MSHRETARNSVLNLLDLTFLQDRARAAPSVYGVAISTVCNLKCPHCLRESLGIRENALMNLESLARYREEIGTSRKISLFGLGEPFLHPKFFEFIALFKGLGLEVATSSHGMSLKPEVREKILDSGLDDLTISMDGADKKTFEELRAGAIWETVIEQVSALSALKKSRGATNPDININMTVMRRNLHQVPALVRLAHKLGAQSVSFSSVVLYKAADLRTSVAEDPEFEHYMEKGRKLSKSLGLPMSFWRQKPVWWEPDFHDPNLSYGCSQLWSNQLIEPDGSMKLCCYIEEDVTNVFETGPIEAFNCDELRRQRRLLMQGKVRPACQGCLYLRERSPSWIQAMINEAAKLTRAEPNLLDEDRRELFREIDRVQKLKDEMYPLHVHLPIETAATADSKSAYAVWEHTPEPALPIY